MLPHEDHDSSSASSQSPGTLTDAAILSNIDDGVRKIAAHQITASDLNTFKITLPVNTRMKFVMSGDVLVSMKETFGLCEGRAEQHCYICESDMIHVRIWLVSSALESVEGRVWTAQTTVTCVTGRWNTLLDASQF